MNTPSVTARGRRTAPTALVVLVVVLLLSGCREIQEVSAATYQPAHVTDVANLDGKQVQFTAEAAERIDLQTATAQRRGRFIVVPYLALIYDGQGVPWVYTTTAPLTFVRSQVVVDRVEGNLAFLSAGLPTGTDVVTVGATEVYGTELGIGDAH